MSFVDSMLETKKILLIVKENNKLNAEFIQMIGV